MWPEGPRAQRAPRPGTPPGKQGAEGAEQGVWVKGSSLPWGSPEPSQGAQFPGHSGRPRGSRGWLLQERLTVLSAPFAPKLGHNRRGDGVPPALPQDQAAGRGAS